MAKANPWKSSFNGGELSPRMAGRTDQEKYASGASLMQNFIPTIQGPLIRRGGFYYVNHTKDSTKRSWLLPFLFQVTGSYVLEFGDQTLRFYTNRGIVTEATKAISGITLASPGVLTITAHGYATGDEIFVSSIVGTTQLNGRFFKVVVIDANHVSLQEYYGTAVNTTTYTAYVSGGTAARIYTLATPYTVAELSDSKGNLVLKTYQSADVMYMAHPNHPLQQLARLGNTNWTITKSPIKNGPFQDKNTTHGSTVYITPTTTTVSGAADNGSGLIRLTVGSTTGIATGNLIEVITVLGTTEANGIWAVTVIDGTHLDLQGSHFVTTYTSGGAITGRDGTACTITAQQSIFTSGMLDELFYIEKPLNDTLTQWQAGIAITNGQRVEAGNNTYVALNAATTGSDTPVHTQGAVSDGKVTWLFEDFGYGVIQCTTFGSATSMTGTIMMAPPNLNTNVANQSYLWAHGKYSTANGWPQVVTLFRSRLTLIAGNQLDLSKSNDFLNFDPKTEGEVSATSAISETIPTANPPRWAVAQNALLIGTAGEEFSVGELDATQALAPSNIDCRRQTSHGSRLVDAVPIEFVTMFVTRSGQQLREMSYSYLISGYASPDLTPLSEHIPKGPNGKQGILQMAWQQEPDYLLWSCTTDGRLVAFTYNKDQQVMAWATHPLGGTDTTNPFLNATVESVCSIPSPDGTQDDLWVQVQRTINGHQFRSVEFLMPYFTDIQANLPNAYYMDCGVTYQGASTKTISGLVHLKGQVVDVLANGGVHPQVTVDSTGTITLLYAVTTAQIGLPCPAQVITMRPEAGATLGTAQGMPKRIYKMIMRLLNTLTGRYGDPYNNKLDRLNWFASEDQMDTPLPLFTGDQIKTFPGGNTTDGYMTYLADTPMPCTLVALGAVMETNEAQ